MAKSSFSRLVKIVTGGHFGLEEEFSRLERFTHFWVLVAKSFVRNRCPVRAAALSYTSLLALIPLLAVAIGVTSSLLKNQGEEKIYGAIDRLVSSFVPPATAEINTNGPATLNPAPAMSVMLAPANSAAATNAVAPAEEGDAGGRRAKGGRAAHP